MNKSLIPLLLWLFTIATIAADEDVNGVEVIDVQERYTHDVSIEKSKELKQRIDLGFANTSGNTDTLNFNGKYGLNYSMEGYRSEALNIGLEASSVLTKDSGTTTNEEYSALLKLEQELKRDWSVYMRVDWLRNVFKNFDHKTMIGLGVGKILFKDESHTLQIKVGGAHNRENYSNTQENETFSSLTQYLEYENRLYQTSKFYLKAGASENLDAMGDDYEILGVIGVNFLLHKDFHFTVEEEISYDALPSIGFKKSDTKTIVRLGYKF